MSLTPIGLSSAIITEINKIPGSDTSSSNVQDGILALSTAIINYLQLSPSGSISIDLANLISLGVYTGSPSGSISPSYSSINFIIDGVNLTNSISRLDLALNSISGSINTTITSLASWNNALQVYTGQQAHDDLTPDYISNHYIIDNDNLTLAVGKLDTALFNVSGSIKATIAGISISGSTGTLQTVTDNGNTTTHSLISTGSGSQLSHTLINGNFTILGNVGINVSPAANVALYVSSSNPSADAPSFIFENSDNVNQTAYDCYSSMLNTHASAFLMRRSRGNKAVPVSVAPNDTLGVFGFRGHDGSVFRQFATFRAIVDGPVSSNNVPTALRFDTGATSAVERMRITSSGSVGIGTTTPDYTKYKLDVAGAIQAQTSGSQFNCLAVPGLLTAENLSLGSNIYGSEHYILNGDGVRTVVNKLDTALFNVSGSIKATIDTISVSSGTLQTVTDNGATTTHAITISTSGSNFKETAVQGALQTDVIFASTSGSQIKALTIPLSFVANDVRIDGGFTSDARLNVNALAGTGALELNKLVDSGTGPIIYFDISGSRVWSISYDTNRNFNIRSRSPLLSPSITCDHVSGNISMGYAVDAVPSLVYKLDVNGSANIASSGSTVRGIHVTGGIVSDGDLNAGSGQLVLGVANNPAVIFRMSSFGHANLIWQGASSQVALDRKLNITPTGSSIGLQTSGTIQCSVSGSSITSLGVPGDLTAQQLEVVGNTVVIGTITNRTSGSQIRDTQLYGNLSVSGSFTLGDTGTVKTIRPTDNKIITSSNPTFGNGTNTGISMTLTPGTWHVDFNRSVLFNDPANGNYDAHFWLEDGTQIIGDSYNHADIYMTSTTIMSSLHWSFFLTIPTTVPYTTYTLFAAKEQIVNELWLMGNATSGSKLVTHRIR